MQENGGETLEELQELFDEMFQADIEAFGSEPHALAPNGCSTSSSSSYISYCASSGSSNKRSGSEISRVKAEGSSGCDARFQSFCFGVSSLAHCANLKLLLEHDWIAMECFIDLVVLVYRLASSFERV